MRFEIPGIPVPQPRQRVAVRFGHATTYTPAAHPVNAFKAATRLAAQSSGVTPLSGPVALSAVFVLPKPASRTRSKDAGRVVAVQVKPDCDNLAKALLDALTGQAWADDAQVARLAVEKRYVVTDADGVAIESPRCEVTIERVE